MSDKVRGALFNTLGDIDGLRVLDAFAGSGAVGLEALSRGAAYVVCLEIYKPSHRIILDNISSLGLRTQVKAVRAGLTGWSEKNPEARFDLIICDPPYDDPQPSAIRTAATHLAPGGTFVLSWPGWAEPLAIGGLTATVKKSYGDSQLIFYKPV